MIKIKNIALLLSIAFYFTNIKSQKHFSQKLQRRHNRFQRKAKNHMNRIELSIWLSKQSRKFMLNQKRIHILEASTLSEIKLLKKAFGTILSKEQASNCIELWLFHLYLKQLHYQESYFLLISRTTEERKILININVICRIPKDKFILESAIKKLHSIIL